MASELRVNTLKDASGNNSVATSVVFNGTAKAWCDADNAAQPQDSFNISGGVDNGTVDYQFNLSSSMGSANYCVPNSPGFAQISCFDHGDITSSRYDIRIFARTDSLTVTDDPTHSVVHGDLA